ncbi:MAG: tripartite tricarboxylate transporter substrate binding protein, partial [Betaproteobacteria bacterium]|nr:tripartite tricarboxylate transporter substrate binding protein [Betaproteobacteria bacterium]
LPLVKAGRLRALAVTSATRFAAAPELPTVAESGIPGFEVITWQGMLAPARTPAAAIRALLHELIRALQSPPVRERLTAEGFIVVGNQPDEFAAVIKSEIQKWTRVVKAAGIKQLELPN